MKCKVPCEGVGEMRMALPRSTANPGHFSGRRASASLPCFLDTIMVPFWWLHDSYFAATM